MPKVVITSYIDPDLDGFACAFAYAELLNKTGIPAAIRFFGDRHVEALYLLEKFHIVVAEDTTTPLHQVILVDASELRDLDHIIKPEQVIEVIDHRKINDAASFKKARIQIELVGAAATLIAEKFCAQKIEISAAAATLLYGAIISNTIDFHVPATTDRDRNMAKWLKTKFICPLDFTATMFQAKSNVQGERLAQRITADFAWFQVGQQKIGIAQLEIMGVKTLITNRLAEIIHILEDIRRQENLDTICISFIDLEEYGNTFCTTDPALQMLLSKILNITFKNTIALKENVIMRKEIVPLLRSIV